MSLPRSPRVTSEQRKFSVNLIGYEEVPAVSTLGGGTFHAAISRSDDEIRYELTYNNLQGTTQQAHIHFGQKSVNGGISVFLCSNLGNGPAGTQPCPQSGTVTGTIRPGRRHRASGARDRGRRVRRAGEGAASRHRLRERAQQHVARW